MPCHDPGAAEAQSVKDREKINGLTRMLCALCDLQIEYEDTSKFLDLVPGLRGWWEQHKADDAERIHREKHDANARFMRDKALDKLTEHDRMLLGLD